MEANNEPKNPPFAVLKENIHLWGELECKVMSGSMEPVIMTGDKIRVVKTSLDKLKRFDIVVFLKDNFLICHAFWNQNTVVGPAKGISVNTFALAGRGKSFDYPIPIEHILGLVVSHQIPWYYRWLIYWNRRKKS